MRAPPVLPDESGRLSALEATRQTFSPAEERFDRITRIAAGVMDTPTALVTLVDDKRQWFKSRFGLDADQTPRDVAFCAHAIAQEEGLVVEDATLDERFSDNPLVTGSPHVRAYAGKVIHAPTGEPVGTLCVIDTQPRTFSQEQLALLADLSVLVDKELERPIPGPQAEFVVEAGPQTRASRLDATTGCWSHDAMLELLMRQCAQADESSASFAIGLLRVERMADLSARIGGEAVEGVLREVAGAVRGALGEADALGRYDPETFIAMLPGTDSRSLAPLAAGVQKVLRARSFRGGSLSLWLKLSVAMVVRDPDTALSARLEMATQALLEARRNGSGIALVAAS